MIIGKLGITLSQYMELTPYECYCRLHYQAEVEREQVATLGNIVRTATVILLNTQLKKDKQIRDPRKIWRFGWEEEEKIVNVPEVTSEQLKKISELL